MPFTRLQKGVLADWQMCEAVCAVADCWEPTMAAYGPVPLDFGCCVQEAGDAIGGDSDMKKRFSVWSFHPPDTDYPLVIRRSSATKSSTPTSTARFIAQTNRLVGGLVIRQTRKSERNCTGDRFAQLESLPWLNNTFIEQTGCTGRGEDRGTNPFGADPSFISSSELFVPGAKPEDFYSPSQIDNRKIPYGA